VAGRAVKTLSPTKSLELLLHPYRLILENTWSDWQFLLRMATPEQRRCLEELYDRGWLVTAGGGLGELTKEVERLCRGFEGAMRTAAFFDSDSTEPGKISADAERAKAACRSILSHCLARRAIENYLPLRSLMRWADHGPNKERSDRRRRAIALAELKKLSVWRRDCYPMKTGYDSTPPDLSNEAWARDLGGFGKDIAMLFEDEQIVSELELRDDGGFGEVNPFVGRLIAAVW
jgi:hypothetical protein